MLLAGVIAFSLFAQQPEPPPLSIPITVNVVQDAVTVKDDSGSFVTNLKPSDFRLYDNEKPQDVQVDVTFLPISLVVAIQASSDTDAVLPKIKKIGPLLQGVVTGDQGEVAILCFDHRIQTLQDFTSDYGLINKAMEKLKTGSTSSRMIDASMQAFRMLRNRPGDRRRVLLLISETRDNSSENRVRDVLVEAQLNNTVVHSVNINRLITTLTARPLPPRPDPFPAGARPLPGNVPPTPEATRGTVSSSANSASFLPLFVEIFKQVKGIFIDNPVEVFTKYTGGREHSFVTEKDLERAVDNIGEELHSQYLLSYRPNNKMDAGWHDIRVEVVDRTGRARNDVKIDSRPGYWMAAVPD